MGNVHQAASPPVAVLRALPTWTQADGSGRVDFWGAKTPQAAQI